MKPRLDGRVRPATGCVLVTRKPQAAKRCERRYVLSDGQRMSLHCTNSFISRVGGIRMRSRDMWSRLRDCGGFHAPRGGAFGAAARTEASRTSRLVFA